MSVCLVFTIYEISDPFSVSHTPNCLCGSSAVEAPNEPTLRQNFQQIQEGESRQANRPILLPAYKPGTPQQAAEQPRAKPSPVPQPRTDIVRNDSADQDQQRRPEQAPPPQPRMGRLIRKQTRLNSILVYKFIGYLNIILSIYVNQCGLSAKDLENC